MKMFVAAILWATVSSAWSEPCTNAHDAVSDLSGALGASNSAWFGLEADAFESNGLSAEVFGKALQAHQTAWQRGDSQKTVLSVIDFSLPSDKKRLWVIDLERKTVLFHEYVAHGKNTGERYARNFSNRNQSLQSSVGLMKTGKTYFGKHGYSLRLEGLERGFNDRAEARAIVMHAADYVTQEFIDEHGRLGRSWGCPALDPEVNEEVINTIKEGSLLFGYFPDENWLNRSRYLNP